MTTVQFSIVRKGMLTNLGAGRTEQPAQPHQLPLLPSRQAGHGIADELLLVRRRQVRPVRPVFLYQLSKRADLRARL